MGVQNMEIKLIKVGQTDEAANSIFTYPSIIAYFFNRQLLRNLRRS